MWKKGDCVNGWGLGGAIFFFLVAVLPAPFTSFLPFCWVMMVRSSVACWELPAEVTDVHRLWGFCCGFVSLVLVSSLARRTLSRRMTTGTMTNWRQTLWAFPVLLVIQPPNFAFASAYSGPWTSEFLTGSQLSPLKRRPDARCPWWFLPRVTFDDSFESLEPSLAFHSLGFEDFLLLF